VSVQDSEGREVESQLLPLTDASLSLRRQHIKAYLGMSGVGTPKYWLTFPVSVPALGFTTYFISGSTTSGI
jgi:alpha-mannosidase